MGPKNNMKSCFKEVSKVGIHTLKTILMVSLNLFKVTRKWFLDAPTSNLWLELYGTFKNFE